jgi:hypothetical protein
MASGMLAPVHKETRRNGKVRVFEKKLKIVDELNLNGMLNLYDTVNLLMEVEEDSEFRMLYDNTRQLEILDGKLSLYPGVTFLEARSCMRKFKERDKWENGNFTVMLAEIREEARQEAIRDRRSREEAKDKYLKELAEKESEPNPSVQKSVETTKKAVSNAKQVFKAPQIVNNPIVRPETNQDWANTRFVNAVDAFIVNVLNDSGVNFVRDESFKALEKLRTAVDERYKLAIKDRQ